MKTAISTQIIEVLDALCEKFGFAIDWSAQNILPYLQELMRKAANYELWTSVMWIVVTGFITAFCWIMVWRLTKTEGFDWYDVNREIVSTVATIFAIAGAIMGIVFILNLIGQTLDIITCLTFPEKIILNMLQAES